MMAKQQIKNNDPIGIPHDKALMFIGSAVISLLARGIHSVAVHVTHDSVGFMIAQGEFKLKQSKKLKDIESDVAAFEIQAFEFAKQADDRFVQYQEQQDHHNKKHKPKGTLQ
jgi:hypothetical protein